MYLYFCMKNSSLPLSVKNTIWWQNAENINIKNDKKMLIKAIIQKGNFEAIKWMKSQYSQQNIVEVFYNSYETEYSPKTLNFWKVVLKTSPLFRSRIDKINAS